MTTVRACTEVHTHCGKALAVVHDGSNAWLYPPEALLRSGRGCGRDYHLLSSIVAFLRLLVVSVCVAKSTGELQLFLFTT